MNHNMINSMHPTGMESQPQMEINPEMMTHPQYCTPFNVNHLPIANITRIMKASLKNKKVKISKSAKETVQDCVSEFISFITSEAYQKSHGEKRKTISGDDILLSLKDLGFEKYAEILKIYLSKYRSAWEMLDKEVNDLIVEDSKIPGNISVAATSDAGKTTVKGGEDDMSIL